MKTKYYILSILLLLALFTFVIPVIYHVITGKGFMTEQEKIMKKYNPELYYKEGRISFWEAW